jgi:alkylation response protein AidB-like acyl-CoA dehydrogenase
MDLLPTPEQHEIIDSSRSFLAGRMGIGRSRELLEAGSVPAVDAAAWAAAAELGWFALGLPEDQGGIGAGLADETLLFREIGRANAPGPFVASVLATRVAAFGGAPELADEIIGGRRVGLVVPTAVDAVSSDGTLRGDVQLVDAIDGLALVATPEMAAIVDVSALDEVGNVPCIDPTARLQRATAQAVTPIATVAADVDRVERRGHVLVAALLAGVAEWSRDTASRHAIDRVQFDKPIGVNQAIKHPCANVAVQAQLAFAQSLFAALAVDEDRPDAELQVLSARVAAAAAADLGTATTLQVLGGMGFTHEHDVHLYIKRAALLAHAFGESATWLARVLELPEAV